MMNRVVLFQPNGTQKSYMVDDIQMLLTPTGSIQFETTEEGGNRIRIQTNMPYMFFIAMEDEED